MYKQFLKDGFGWGFGLWAVGYVLGIILFAFVSPAILGWVILPIGTLITLWVLSKKVKGNSFSNDALLSITWTLIAIVCDYYFLVKAFKPTDGYYKLDVYVYYALTCALPLIVGWYKRSGQEKMV